MRQLGLAARAAIGWTRAVVVVRYQDEVEEVDVLVAIDVGGGVPKAVTGSGVVGRSNHCEVEEIDPIVLIGVTTYHVQCP